MFGRLVTGVVIESGFVDSLCRNANNCCGIVSNHLVVEWETSRVYKFGTMVGFVLDSLGEDGCEGVNSIQLVIGDNHDQWRKVFWMASGSLLNGFPSRGGEGIMGLFEKASDCVGRHVGLL